MFPFRLRSLVVDGSCDLSCSRLCDCSLMAVSSALCFEPRDEENHVKRLGPSVVRAKAAMRGHFKTGHMEWPGT
jgi:hypothetical protein